MNVYMSLWTKPENINSDFIDMWKLSLALANKYYGKVDLITDNNGYDILKNLPFNDFHIVLDNVPDYPTIWSLGKIYAYNQACKISQHFLHLDSDVFLWEKLPEDLTNSDIFCQSEDLSMRSAHYNIFELYEIYKRKYPPRWIDHNNLLTYNMGIFGGNNINLIQGYCNYVIDLIENIDYKWIWELNNFNFSQDSKILLPMRKSILVEQANLAIFCENQDIKPSLLFKNFDDKSYKKNMRQKYTHLMLSKEQPDIRKKISDRVMVEPYNLSPQY